MADITKCDNENCSRKTICYRYTAPESAYQAYFLDVFDEDCEYFIEDKLQSSNK